MLFLENELNIDRVIICGWWFGTLFDFSHILGIIIPIDYFFFRGIGLPPTRYDTILSITSSADDWTREIHGISKHAQKKTVVAQLQTKIYWVTARYVSYSVVKHK